MITLTDVDMTIILTQHLRTLGHNPVIELAPTDETLKFPVGATAKLLPAAANRAGYEVEAMGGTHASLLKRPPRLMRA